MTSNQPYWLTRAAFVGLVSATVASTGCLIVDDASLRDVEAHSSGETGPGMNGANRCGVVDTPLINSLPAGQPILIDTTMASNSLRSSCGRGTEGNDVFFALDVAEGDYWHFHLAANPDDPNASMRDPVLYLFSSGPEGNDGNRTCSDRSCDFFADRCTTSSDEHFAFVASTAGRWYLGIDDHNTGGGTYVLNAYLRLSTTYQAENPDGLRGV